MNHQATIKVLNDILANLFVLNTKLHNYHWNITGVHFGLVHVKTEAYYNFCFEQFDEVAERILMLGGKPIVTPKGYAEAATLAEEAGVEFDLAYVFNIVIQDFSTLLQQCKAANEAADSCGDTGTQDMLGGLIGWFEKEIWMLKSSLPKS